MTHPFLFWLAVGLAALCCLANLSVLLSPYAADGAENVARALRAAFWVCAAAAAGIALG